MEPKARSVRLAPMHSHRRSGRPATHLLVTLVALTALVIAGCTTAAGPSTSGSLDGSPSEPPASAPPSGPSTTADPNGPVGTDAPPGGSDPGAVDPGGEIVVPRRGQLDVAPIPADSLAATVDGRRVVVTATFTSGVEPCSVLDTVIVQRGERSFAITLRQGRGPGDNVCIMIAVVKRTLIDLGELDPGTYTITDATGGATAITVAVD